MLPETFQYRRSTDDLLADFVGAWRRLWPVLDINALDVSFPRWAVAAAVVVGRWRAADVALAAEYLAALTDFPPVPSGVLDPRRFTAGMHVTTVATVKRAMTDGLSLSQASGLAFSRSAGSASRHVLDAGRQVVMGTAVADPACEGWRRVGSGSCGFCSLLISRGAVYRAETADFPSHDSCRCGAELVLG